MSLTDNQIKNGFWYFRRQENFPPPPIEYPEEYVGTDSLNVACTQRNLSDYKQKKLVEKWCQVLPKLSQVRYLWFSSRTNQALFDAACRMEGLEGLLVKWSGIKDLDGLSRLPNLKYLHLGSSPGVTDIRILGTLKQLVVLEIENFRRIRDLGPLGALTQLEGLMVNGSTWTTQVVKSLEPLRQLQSLKYLYLINLKAEDGTLKPLQDLTSLVNLTTGYRWPASEFRMLRECLPHLKFGSPFDEGLIAKFAKSG